LRKRTEPLYLQGKHPNKHGLYNLMTIFRRPLRQQNAAHRIAIQKSHLYDVYQHKAHHRSQQAAGVTLKPA
jgi:hypothetical protein